MRETIPSGSLTNTMVRTYEPILICSLEDSRSKLMCIYFSQMVWKAAMLSTHTPAGFYRDSWGFFKHPDFSSLKFNTYLQAIQGERLLLRPYTIFGGDRDLKAIEACRATGSSTGLPVHFQHSDIPPLPPSSTSHPRSHKPPLRHAHEVQHRPLHRSLPIP